jgi:tetratricopeptide (TPR) repeat protein
MTDFENNPDLTKLMAIDPAGLAGDDAMTLAALLVDLSDDAANAEGLHRAAAVLAHLHDRDLKPSHRARWHYFEANLWSARRRRSPAHQTWTWRSEEIDQELLALRRAVASEGFAELGKLERAQAFTNLGNVLNHIGRFVEAIEAWDRALALVPNLAMANGNRGIGLSHYASGLHDPGHNIILAMAAREALQRATDPKAVVESPGLEPALAHFAKHAEALDAYLRDNAVEADLHGHSLGRGRRERDYRRWCLAHRLFINSLNDAGPWEIAARDVMMLPSITTVGLEDGPGPPPVIAYFNLIKQEYAAARFACWEGLTASGVHFADRGVQVYNTLDYPAVGFAIERLKMAFRGAYAIFDKVAFCLNAYLDLGHSERQVSFRNLWFVKGKGKVLHANLDGLANWPLRGLFWLSKDVFEDDFKEVTEPDAHALYDLRNHLEHKFVSVHDMLLRAVSVFPAAQAPAGVYDLGFEDLAARTGRQLKLARAAIMYLTLAIHAEERRRAAERSPGLTMPMSLDTWDDAWKRRD